MSYRGIGRSNSRSRLPGDCPITWTILGANAATFVTTFVSGAAIWSPLTFFTGSVAARPWTVVTYPLVAETHILWLLLGGYFFWVFGGSLERAWGRRDYLLFLGLVSAGAAIGLWIGGQLLGRASVLSGLWLPLASIVTAWSVINQTERVLMYFVIPMQARWLGIISAVLVFFSFPFPLGVFALAGPGVAWWYVRIGRYRLSARPAASPPVRRSPRFTTFNPLALLRRWRLKRQFKSLMKRSGIEESRRRERH